MIKLEHKTEDAIQPWVVYAVKGRKKDWLASFSTKKAAQQWMKCYGDPSG